MHLSHDDDGAQSILVLLVEVILSVKVCSFGLARPTRVDGWCEHRWMTTGGQQGALSSLDILVGTKGAKAEHKKASSVVKVPILFGERAELLTLMLWPSLCFAFAVLTESSPFHHVYDYYFIFLFQENI